MNIFKRPLLASFIFAFIVFHFANLESQVLPGIDVLVQNNYLGLEGKKLILFTNSTGRNSKGTLTAEILAYNDKVKLVAIVSPEHGFFAAVSAGVKVDNDHLFGVPVYSLYNDIKKPGSQLLSQCDAIVVDIQDIGVRSYTYVSSLYKLMQAAAENQKPIYILDRPNPLGANNIDGNVLEKGMESFVGIAPIAYIHGMTIGELAFMFNEEGWLNEGNPTNLKCDLKVIKMQNYTRSMVWEDTGLMWFPTSPNVPSVNAARGLAILGIFGELGFISIGIGTTTPFQLLGSPDFKWTEVNSYLAREYFSGVQAVEARYNPQFAMYSGKTVKGIFLNFFKSEKFTPYLAGVELMLAIRKSEPNLFNSTNIKDNSKNMFNKVTGTRDLFYALFNNIPDENVLLIAQRGLSDFINLRSKYTLYN